MPTPSATADEILAAARSAFVDPDAEASMAEVSRRAGVGRATLYRNSPGRRELLEALYTDEVNTICEGTDYLGGATIFCAWLRGGAVCGTSEPGADFACSATAMPSFCAREPAVRDPFRPPDSGMISLTEIAIRGSRRGTP